MANGEGSQLPDPSEPLDGALPGPAQEPEPPPILLSAEVGEMLDLAATSAGLTADQLAERIIVAALDAAGAR